MSHQHDLFEAKPPEKLTGDTAAHDPVELASYRLAVQFTEDDQLPIRYRKRSAAGQKTRKVKEDSEIEKRFRQNVRSWRVLIETMLAKLKPEQAWRYINLSPSVDQGITKVTDNGDFLDFVDYLILRRDKENCDADELGGLAALSVAVQREIEKHLPDKQSGE